MSVLNEMALESFDLGLDKYMGVRNGPEIKFCFYQYLSQIQKARKAMNTVVLFFTNCG